MGAIFNCKIKSLQLKIGDYTKTLDKQMQVQLRQAAREWLRAVIEKVPVYSGMSIASLLPLGGYLHVKIPIHINPNSLSHHYGNIPHGIEAGVAAGGYYFAKNKFTYTFEFSTEVPQFIINDISVGLGSPPLIHETPWFAIEAGAAAFKSYLDKNLYKKVPKVSDFVYEQTIGE